MSRWNIVRRLRFAFAFITVALVFTNLFSFLTGFNELTATGIGYMAAHPTIRPARELGIPPYTIRVLGYVIVAAVMLLDVSCIRRAIKKPIFRWAFATSLLFTWGMLLRTMQASSDTNYELLLPFYSLINSITFLLSCVVIFDDQDTLQLAKRAIVVASLVGAALNLYEVAYPGAFSAVNARAAGLYTNPNQSGMALVLGCVIGLPAVSRRWREGFVLAIVAGVVATFSREAMIALLIVVVAGVIARAVSPGRLLLGGMVAGTLFVAINAGEMLKEQGILNSENLSRLAFRLSDQSANARRDVAYNALKAFGAAPLIGNGLGTSSYWEEQEAHNLYLSFLADYGIVGILFIPALVLSIRRASWDSHAFGIVFLLWCLFDHFILRTPFAMISLAIQAGESGAVPLQSLDRSQRAGIAPLGEPSLTVKRSRI